MWQGLSGILGGLLGGNQASQNQGISQQNLANQLGALQSPSPYPIPVPIPPPVQETKLAAYEEDVEAEVETIEEPDGSIVIKAKP